MAMERNPSPPALTEAEEKVLSTDCIGDTVFSKRWVLRVLLGLMKLKEKLQDSLGEANEADENFCAVKELDSELEEEFCELWDMTTNQDVCKFLNEQEAVELLFETTIFSNYPRLTEICIGILGNMVCLPEIAEEITHVEKYRTILLSEVNNDDPQTLIELTRLIRTCLAVDKHQSVWFETIKALKTLNQLAFILESSLNVDLLHNVSELVDFIFDSSDDLMESVSLERMLSCLCEAMQQIKESKPQSVDVIIHIIQLITTTKSGLQAFGDSTTAQNLLCEVLAKTDLNLVTAMGRLPMLASSLSILSSLWSSYQEKFTRLLVNGSCVVLKMVLTLEVLQKVFVSISKEASDGAITNGQVEKDGAKYQTEEEQETEAYNHYAFAAIKFFCHISQCMEKKVESENWKDLLDTFKSLKSQVHIVLNFFGSSKIFQDEVRSLKEQIRNCLPLAIALGYTAHEEQKEEIDK